MTTMNPAMTIAEFRLFQSFLKCSTDYAEFGCGGSTIEACKLVDRSVTSLDSSEVWLNDVFENCKLAETRITPTLLFANIGETRDWGYPVDRSSIETWPRYQTLFWTSSNHVDADLYLIDGRFRIACFMQTLLRSSDASTIMIHDFSDRPNYHIIRNFAQEIARAERLSVFRKKAPQDLISIERCAIDCQFDPT